MHFFVVLQEENNVCKPDSQSAGSLHQNNSRQKTPSLSVDTKWLQLVLAMAYLGNILF